MSLTESLTRPLTRALNPSIIRATGGAGDEFFDNVKILMDFQGVKTQGIEDWVELSSNRAISYDTNPLSYSQDALAAEGFGTYMYLDGNGDRWCSLADVPAFDPGTGDFTLEWRQYKTGWNVIDYCLGGSGLNIQVRRSSESYEFRVVIGGQIRTTMSGQSAMGLNQWNHIAVCRAGTNLRVFVNGTQMGTTVTNSDNITLTSAFFIGSVNGTTAPGNSHTDDVRYTVGVARYTEAFTPPDAPHPTS